MPAEELAGHRLGVEMAACRVSTGLKPAAARTRFQTRPCETTAATLSGREPPPLFSKAFMEVIALAIDEGRVSARRAADLLDLTVDDLATFSRRMGSKPLSICEGPMARHRGPVLVDTNVILECFRVGAWRALAGGYGVETVEDCVTETQTGFQRRRPEQQIDAAHARRIARRRSIQVGDAERAAVAVRESMFSSLDVGERSLWAHALTRNDAWVLCGPDKASLRFGVRLGLRIGSSHWKRFSRDAGIGRKSAEVGLYDQVARKDARGTRDLRRARDGHDELSRYSRPSSWTCFAAILSGPARRMPISQASA